jgi:hypothetical protein
MERWGQDYQEDAPGRVQTLPGADPSPPKKAAGTPPPTAAGQGALPGGVDQAWWSRVQRKLGNKAGSVEDLKDPQHRAWLNRQLRKKRQKKVGGGETTAQKGGAGPETTPQTGGTDPPPQTGGPEPMPGGGATQLPGDMGYYTGWGGKTMARHQGGQGPWTPWGRWGAPGGYPGPTPPGWPGSGPWDPGAGGAGSSPAGYPGSPNYPVPGQGFPLPGSPGGPGRMTYLPEHSWPGPGGPGFPFPGSPGGPEHTLVPWQTGGASPRPWGPRDMFQSLRQRGVVPPERSA